MKLKTPLNHRKYRVLSQQYSKRTWRMAIKCWWDWDVMPWFKKLDYAEKKGVKYKYYRFARPFVKNSIRCVSESIIKNKWYQFLPLETNKIMEEAKELIK